MKLWDSAWQQLADREGLELLDYFRYVDDCRNMLFCLLEGWRWVDDEFKFDEAWQQEDLNSDVSDSYRTMTELTKAMSSLISYIEFEGEEPGMFTDNKLPTLDTAIWWTGSCFLYEFWEKPTVPNRVLQRDTALAESAIRSSLNQEVVRRLLHCHNGIENSRKCEFLSTFAQKLVNSGFSVPSAQIILVHGVLRYVEIVKNSRLPETNPRFKPLHFNREFNSLERKLQKYLAKSNWYSSEKSGSNWRSKLPVEWKGDKPLQSKMPKFQFTTILQVQSSQNSRLLKELAKVEPRLTKSSGYHVKLVEKGGKPLSKCFSKDFNEARCNRVDCEPCLNPARPGPTLCKVKNIVYESVCAECDAEFKLNPSSRHKGKYVGQTARTLYERSGEHVSALKNFDSDSFMWKHWALVHPNLESPPKFLFTVAKCHKDPLSRLVHESIRIEAVASMNSKA